MALTSKQKKYLKKHFRKGESLEKIASRLSVNIKEVEKYTQKRIGREKYKKSFIQKGESSKNNLKKKILSFNFRNWLSKNSLFIVLLLILVLTAYGSSLRNDFVSDDIGAIAQNELLDAPKYISNSFPSYLRPLFYFFINKLFGRTPMFYRLLNIVFHWGSTVLVFLLLDLLIGFRIALFTSSILAVHPLLTEAVIVSSFLEGEQILYCLCGKLFTCPFKL